MTLTNVTRSPAAATGGWAFYTDNDVSNVTMFATPQPTYPGSSYTVSAGPAGFIVDGAMDRHHVGTTEGVVTETISIPAGAKYIRVTYWANSSQYYQPFSCIGNV